MKFLYLTDTHLTGKGPSSRTDNFVNAIFEKFEEIKQVIIDENIEAVFHGGDLFDKPVVSLGLTGQVANFIKSTGVPWYVVPGNHDLFGYNIKSLLNTSLGLLNQAGVITILYRGHGPVIFTNPNGDTISFEGQEYHMDIDHRPTTLDYHIISQADTKILIPHSMLLDKEYFPEVPYTNTANLKDETRADLILVGHYHDGYKRHIIRHTDGSHTHVFNPGSMTRDEGSKGNLTRRPQYVIINYPDKKQWTFDAYEFKCAADGKKIFDRSHITTKQAKDKYLQSFEQKLSDVKLDAVDVRDVLDKLIKKDGTIDKEIAQEARDRLVEAEQTIDDVAKQMTGYIEKPDNIYIEGIDIKGFQSHEDTSVQFSAGFNAIIGPSDSGKSAIIRAIRFALYNEPKGAEFIRQGAKSCEVTIRFSDGGRIRRARTQTSAGTYDVTDPSGQTISLKGFSNHIPVDVPNAHQMPYIQLTKDLESSLNVGYQLDAPFLIGESPGTRAAIIGRLTGVNLVDTSVREIGKEILGNTRDIKTIGEQVETVESHINQFGHLPEMKQKIDQANQVITSVELLERLREEFTDLESHLTNVTLEEQDITSELHKLEALKELAPRVEQVEQILRERQELESLDAMQYEVMETESRIGGELQDALDEITSLDFVKSLEQLVTETNGLKALQSDILTVTDEENALKHQLFKLRHKNVSAYIDHIQGHVDNRSILIQLNQDLGDNLLEKENLQAKIREAYRTEGAAWKQHAEALEENGTCPTCHQIIQGGHIHVN